MKRAIRMHGIGRAAVVGLLAQISAAQTADFDRLPEGFMGPRFVDNGIEFSNLVDGWGSSGEVFVVERADAVLSGMQGFTHRKAMGFHSYVPGPSAKVFPLNAARRFDISRGSPANQASIELFVEASAGNTITLQAIAGTTVVASQTVAIPSGPVIHHLGLSVAGPWFDHLRVLGGGFVVDGTFFALVDHVVIGSGGAGAESCFGDGTQPTDCPCTNSGPPVTAANSASTTGIHEEP